MIDLRWGKMLCMEFLEIKRYYFRITCVVPMKGHVESV